MGRYRAVTVADDGTVLGERAPADGGEFVGFAAALDLLWIEWASESCEEAAVELWALQDGYGTAGHTPVQGWDWSGIRDSTPQARAAMFAVARRWLPEGEVAARLGMEVGVLAGLADRLPFT